MKIKRIGIMALCLVMVMSILVATPKKVQAALTPYPGYYLVYNPNHYDANVVTLQEMLGYMEYPVGYPDGYFGSNTLYCVKRFQSEHGLVADGIVGYTTWHTLDLASGGY